MRRLVLLALPALLLAGCGGTSPFQACVQHSTDEGVARDVAEQGCRDAGLAPD